ncbi:MAG: DUF1156 domain-containing protein [Leptospirales bacterium]|nr:DUF1156 domain-containing protein [Leptospirales bacterium]
MNDRTFIEDQFPVSKVSKESYKERMANYSQTLTGLGKWWGRKPLVLVRAALLGLLLPATDDSEKDREVFLALMTMDEEGLWRRKEAAKRNIAPTEIVRVLTDEEHHDRVVARVGDFASALPGLTHDLKSTLFGFVTTNSRKEDSFRWKKDATTAEKVALERLAFQSLYYDEKIEYGVRAEHLEGPSPEAWQKINSHLGTSAASLPELVRELGMRRFGHVPRVGDAFCGGGSIPFEAARLGCDVYASDLNPVAALLTWAALNIVGGGPEVAEEVRRAQEEIYNAVDRQITEWGIEHNAKGHRADAYLYCMEVLDPETGWRVPLAPSWVIGEKTKTVAILEPLPKEQRYRIRIKMDATPAEMKAAKAGTVQGGYVVHPKNKNRVPMSLIRRENAEGLRLWESDDIVPRPDDVFQERLYCIRWVAPYYEIKDGKVWKRLTVAEAEALDNFERRIADKTLRKQEERYYAEPDAEDQAREERVLELLRERFVDWQKQGFIPDKKIEPGPKTSEPIRTRGWTHWHQLFPPRQLLFLGATSLHLMRHNDSAPMRVASLLALGRVTDWVTKLCRWGTGQNRESIAQTFFNQALNVMYNFGAKGLSLTLGNFFNADMSREAFVSSTVCGVCSALALEADCDVWITDPPYADAVNYHELSEFFLAWYEKHLAKLFPEWSTDSRRALAIKGEGEDFRRSMVAAYSNLTKHMPDNGLQIVMFTHQDAGVWADLAVILWASGLHVTAAWTIATETTSALKDGNYVQGTVLLVLRKNTSTETAFLDELVPRIEEEVRRQVESMERIEDKEEPNFGDTDYQLAAYAAALRVLTGYGQIEDLDVERELTRPRGKGVKSALETIVENARDVAASIRIPEGLGKLLWNDLAPVERLYLRGLDLESKGELRAGAYQELARTYGVRDYPELLASARANEARVKSAREFSNRNLGTEGFGSTLVRQLLYAVSVATTDESPQSGRNYLKTEVEGFGRKRAHIVALLRYLARFQHTLPERAAECRMAELLAGLIENDID